MVAARTAVRGLSSDELQSIRDTLATGRKPKVRFTESAGQVAGQTGQVVELNDPAVSDEWLVVRFGGDELPFSPTDLSIPPRGASRRAEPRPQATAEPTPAPEPSVARSAVPAARTPAAGSPTAGSPTAGSPTARTPAADAATSTGTAGPATQPVSTEPKPARRAVKSARPKASAGLTVTLAYTDGDWTVSATQGSKPLAKPHPVRPAEALKMVGLIDAPGVREAVEQIMAAERSAAQREAETLRAKLAAIETRLAELRDVG
jgi:hypothetical protein